MLFKIIILDKIEGKWKLEEKTRKTYDSHQAERLSRWIRNSQTEVPYDAPVIIWMNKDRTGILQYLSSDILSGLHIGFTPDNLATMTHHILNLALWSIFWYNYICRDPP